jgi:hypothetical protein
MVTAYKRKTHCIILGALIILVAACVSSCGQAEPTSSPGEMPTSAPSVPPDGQVGSPGGPGIPGGGGNPGGAGGGVGAGGGGSPIAPGMSPYNGPPTRR